MLPIPEVRILGYIPAMRPLFSFMFMVLLASCSHQNDMSSTYSPDPRLAFPDLIDFHGIPAGGGDWATVAFFDQGAWFGFTLPPADQSEFSGGFGGPFLLNNGQWLGQQLIRLELTDPTTTRSVGLPGSLEKELVSGDLRIVQSLWFDSSQSTLIRSRLHNKGGSTIDFVPQWAGNVFPEIANLEGTDTGVIAHLVDGTKVRVKSGQAVGESRVTENSYLLALAESISIAPGDSIDLTIAVTMTPSDDSDPDSIPVLASIEASHRRNIQRWNGYLDAIDKNRSPDDPAQILAVKSVQTMVNNWRGPAGRFRHGGLFPSSNVSYFNGFWAWDSWKHAVGLALFDPEIAVEQMRLVFAHQDDLGMIADVVYLDANEDNWRDTKPPLAGWALEKVYEKTGQIDLVRELYPRLVAYHEFWYAHRDHDGDGLCEYGSTDGTIVAARWESGMDNAVRFDATEMLQNGPRAWSMNQESVDLNSYLYREKLALQKLAAALDNTGEAERWEAESVILRRKIQDTMFDDVTGWFYDIGIESGTFVNVQGPEGWTPLWAGVASIDQAARLRTTMLDTTRFRTFVPFPTVARDHPEFSDGYWRGLVWIDQVYFAIDGLRSYGYGADADELTHQVIANLHGATEPGQPLRENYHPLTGAGHNVRHFSWTASHLLMMVQAIR